MNIELQSIAALRHTASIMSEDVFPPEKMNSETPCVLIANAKRANPKTNIPLAAVVTFAVSKPSIDAIASTPRIAITASI